MKLNATNFFNHLIFHPFHAKTKKGKVLSLTASIALGVFSLGLCHITLAIRACWIKKPKGAAKKANDLKKAICKKQEPGDLSEIFPPYPKSTSKHAEAFLNELPFPKKHLKDSTFNGNKSYAFTLNLLPKENERTTKEEKGALPDRIECTFHIVSYNRAFIDNHEWKTFPDWTVVISEESTEKIDFRPSWIDLRKEGLINTLNELFADRDVIDINTRQTWKLSRQEEDRLI